MKANLNPYRLAGVVGGLLLAAGQFVGYLCVLQLIALVPVMLLALRDKRPRWAALAGLYMGIMYTIPQMVYLRMPIPITVILLVWMTILLITLCISIAYFLPRHPVLGPLAVGAVWYILDWINFTAVPIWGMAQSFARSWTAYPFLIQFISITGISGVLFAIGILQGLWAHVIVMFTKLNRLSPSADAVEPWGEYLKIGIAEAFVILLLAGANTIIWLQKPAGSLKVAAAGWVFDDRSEGPNPNERAGFEKLFVGPAKEAAAQGARIFTTGEMGFYLAKHEWDERIEEFATVARANDLWLVVGYFHVTDDENRIFFMSPEGEIVHQYTKTYLTPYEPGKKGDGVLKTFEVDGLTVGAMICQDDNFSKLTRYYGDLKADILLCPTADWWTIKDAHLQAVRARTIECGYGIARGAACGISAAISARGEVLTQHDHYRSGPGYVIADVPVYKNRTFFSRFGHWPSLVAAAACIICIKIRNHE
ncbi:MAG: carbon-nitrogen hydrolase family protein [Phycisphaerae bacterium]|nr:carbon-nitrogen hydrolase family protein [Phycisphaerae bacterium]